MPGCNDQVLELVDLISEINISSGADRQIDFLTLREDYSGSENLENRFEDQKSLINTFNKISDKLNGKNIDQLYIDYGYALYGPSVGFPGPPLRQVGTKDLRPKGYPQISLVVDILGDVYLYREAGFIDRPGAERYIIGRITQKKSLDKIIKEFLNKSNGIVTKKGDIEYFDAFDHLVTNLLNQAEADENFGIPFDKGPIKDRIFNHNFHHRISVSHPTLSHPTLPDNK